MWMRPGDLCDSPLFECRISSDIRNITRNIVLCLYVNKLEMFISRLHTENKDTPISHLCFLYFLTRWTSRADTLLRHSVVTHSESDSDFQMCNDDCFNICVCLLFRRFSPTF